MSDRRNAADYVAAGGALLGVSAATDGLVAYDRKRRGMDGPIRAASKRQFTRRHAGQVAAKLGGRAMFATGAPLAAYGGYKMVKPDGKPVPRLDPKRDVVKPVARGVALRDLADEQERRFAKAELARTDQRRLVRRKNSGKNLSIAGGTLGLAALGLRAPEAARALTKIPKLNRTPLKQIAAKEPGATKASNALGIAAIGTGSVGSFNYASQQKIEAKQFKKNLGDGIVSGIGRVRVLSSPKKDMFDVLDSRDVRRLVPRGRLVWAKQGTTASRKKKVVIENPVKYTAPAEKVAREAAMNRRPLVPQQMELDFGKSDRFLRGYGDRISPSAEQGYKYLKRGRNARAADTAVSVGFAGLSGGVGVHALKRGSKGWAAVGGAGAALSGISAARSGRDTARWNQKLGKIKAKGRERAAAGEFGPGRVAKSAGKKAEGATQAAAGGAALGLGLSANRLVNAAERAGNVQVANWRDKRVARVGNPVVRTIPGASKNTKDRAKKRTKAGQQRINTINAKANRANAMIRRGAGGGTRGALITAGFATAVPSVWMGSRKVVEKADQHDVDAFMGGALATAGAYHGGLYATKRVDRKAEKKIADDVDMRRTIAAHRKSVGLPKDARKGDSRWLKYHRTFPTHTTGDPNAGSPTKRIPGVRWKRAMSYAQGGKSQVAITGALAAGGGLAAARVNRKIDPVSDRKVRKAFGLPAGRLVPKSPLMRKPSVRRSYVGTSLSGKKFTVRGSVR